MLRGTQFRKEEGQSCVDMCSIWLTIVVRGYIKQFEDGFHGHGQDRGGIDGGEETRCAGVSQVLYV